MYKVPYIADVSRKLVGKQTKGTKDVQPDGTTPGAIKVPKGAGLIRVKHQNLNICRIFSLSLKLFYVVTLSLSRS